MRSRLKIHLYCSVYHVVSWDTWSFLVHANKKRQKKILIKYCILKVGFAKSEIYSKLLKLVICSNPHSKCSISRKDTCSGLNKHRFYKAVNSQIFI